jgi:calmodulin
MTDKLVRYHNCPVVCFVGSGLTLSKEFAHSKVITQKEVHAYIKNEVARVKADIKKIFDAFDTDKSGFIDKTELKGVAAGLGIGMGEIDCDNMIRDLDLNRDGKISPDEFNLWWLCGRKGSTGKMS